MKDAWKKFHDLLEEFTTRTKVRADIQIVAHACDRGIELMVGERRETKGLLDPIGKWIWHSTGSRNVSTMREVAKALNEACDFVDDSNPEWASHARM